MTNNTGNEMENTQPEFDVNAYRSKNQDLKSLSDEKLTEHFQLFGRKERRTFAYCRTTIDRLSMKYLRGHGLEIGAGNAPIPLFGETVCTYADLSDQTVFGSTGKEIIQYDFNHPTPLIKKFDFVIASHVLEHVDSLARGLMAMAQPLKPGGMAYIILPNMENDADLFWIPEFGRIHHIIEFFSPRAFKARHEQDFCNGMTHVNLAQYWERMKREIPEDLKEDIIKRKLSPKYDYFYHRHSYNFGGWISLLLFLTRMIPYRMTLLDAAEGEERSDCHFIFKRESDRPDKNIRRSISDRLLFPRS